MNTEHRSRTWTTLPLTAACAAFVCLSAAAQDKAARPAPPARSGGPAATVDAGTPPPKSAQPPAAPTAPPADPRPAPAPTPPPTQKPVAKPAAPRPEDDAVVKNLELLMMMEMLKDYDLLDDAE